MSSRMIATAAMFAAGAAAAYASVQPAQRAADGHVDRLSQNRQHLDGLLAARRRQSIGVA